MQDSQQKGLVFNVQKFSVHDGEGIRTIAFLKGCPLRCRWCSNPESQSFKPERAYNPNRCLSSSVCGRCVEACRTGGVSLTGEGLIRFDRSKCAGCGDCVKRCPTGSQTWYGQEYTVAEIMKKVEEDEIFYARSGGGLTLSGGEPMAQADFSLALLREARKAHVHTAMESCGCYPLEVMDQACRLLNRLIFDIKCLDPEKHRKFTGQDNGQILRNIRHAFENYPDLPILIRTPVVPGFNDSEEELMGIRRMLPDRSNVTYEVLTFHRLGMPKYGYLGRQYLMGDAVADDAFMNRIREKLKNFKR